jgi:hypothetical protein
VLSGSPMSAEVALKTRLTELLGGQ